MSKINCITNKITGSHKTFNVGLCENGYVRTYGGCVAIGYSTNGKRRFELSASIDDIKRLISDWEAAQTTNKEAP